MLPRAGWKVGIQAGRGHSPGDRRPATAQSQSPPAPATLMQAGGEVGCGQSKRGVPVLDLRPPVVTEDAVTSGKVTPLKPGLPGCKVGVNSGRLVENPDGLCPCGLVPLSIDTCLCDTAHDHTRPEVWIKWAFKMVPGLRLKEPYWHDVVITGNY